MLHDMRRWIAITQVVIVIGCGTQGGTVRDMPSGFGQDTTAVIVMARHAYNDRRAALGFERLPGILVERFLGSGDLHFVQFAMPDTSYHGGNIVRVSKNQAVVVDTLPTQLPCTGSHASFSDSSDDRRPVMELAARSYWAALGPTAANCSRVIVTVSTVESDGTIILQVMEDRSNLIYGGGIVRIRGDSAEVVNLLQR